MSQSTQSGAHRHVVTTVDVARDAGVSRSTVSLVLRNNPVVAEATRRRVLASIEKLAYVYDRTAASLRSLRSGTIGVVVTDLTNPFFGELTSGIDTALSERGLVGLLGQNSEDVERQTRLVGTMREHRTDGIVLCAAHGTKPEDIAAILGDKSPLVLVARRVPGIDVDYVGVDNRLGTRLVAEHLLSLGHRRFAFVGGREDSTARAERIDGVLEAFSAAGAGALTVDIGPTAVTRKAGYDAARQLMAADEPPTAMVCYNDAVAFGALLGLRASGLEPGRDCAVTGFDDVEEAALQHPALTTVTSDPLRLGRLAVETLLWRSGHLDAPPEFCIQPPRLVVRESSGGLTGDKPHREARVR